MPKKVARSGRVEVVVDEEPDDVAEERYKEIYATVARVNELLVPGATISRELVVAIQDSWRALFDCALQLHGEKVDVALSLPEWIQEIRSHEARMNARLRHSRSPKSDAKAGALHLWMERQQGQHPKLATVEQFAIEVMRRWPILKSAKVICAWSAGWTKDVREGRTPAC